MRAPPTLTTRRSIQSDNWVPEANAMQPSLPLDGRLLGGKAPTTAVGLRSPFSPKNLTRLRRGTLAGSRPIAPAARAILASRQAETVTLDLDFYRLLQIQPTTSRESTSRAYER
jgi:hypothetical protein